MRKRNTVFASACAAVLASGCAQYGRPPAHPGAFDASRFAPIDEAIAGAIGDHKLPGAVFRLERHGAVYEKAFGQFTYDNAAPAVTMATLFDAASLTKIVVTAPAVMLMVEEGKLALDARLTEYFPECAGEGRDQITVRQLLTHTSGLPAGLPARPAWRGDAAAHALACRQVPTDPPGSAFRYSDVNYILLGHLVQRASGLLLNRFAHERIFTPLKMHDSGYLPLATRAAARIAPTQLIGAEPGPPRDLQGEVHDPTTRRMEGVAGSAGLFTTAADLARFARMLLAGGELDGVRLLRSDSVRLMTTVQSPPQVPARRGMGMDIDSPFARPRGTLFPVGSYGHTGFTGCILWVDPYSGTFYVFLSNRVYPDDKSNILDLYGRLGTLAAQAVSGFDFTAVPGLPAAGAR